MNTDECCIICLQEDNLYELCCKQKYHITCAIDMIKSSKKCPICKNTISSEIISNIKKINNCLNDIINAKKRIKHLYDNKKHIEIKENVEFFRFALPELPSLPDYSFRSIINIPQYRLCNCPSYINCNCNNEYLNHVRARGFRNRQRRNRNGLFF